MDSGLVSIIQYQVMSVHWEANGCRHSGQPIHVTKAYCCAQSTYTPVRGEGVLQTRHCTRCLLSEEGKRESQRSKEEKAGQWKGGLSGDLTMKVDSEFILRNLAKGT